jgi:hypothetical protein
MLLSGANHGSARRNELDSCILEPRALARVDTTILLLIVYPVSLVFSGRRLDSTIYSDEST